MTIINIIFGLQNEAYCNISVSHTLITLLNNKFMNRQRQYIELLRYCLLICILLTGTLVYTQHTITGTVKGPDGEVLIGASVRVQDSQAGAITNVNGQYSIQANQGNVLIYSYIGHQSKSLVVGENDVMDVFLVLDEETLEDVVVIGYGEISREDVTGAISSVAAEDIENLPQVSIDQLLQGQASGVTVTQNSGAPGSAVSVKIRGVTSLTGSNEPLYVIDGVPVSGDARNTATSGRPVTAGGGGFENSGERGVSPLAGLNPNDIESIDILKDASATAIYGSRASNGVVLITTKKGKTGTSKINYDTYYATQVTQNELDVLSLPEFARLQNALANQFGVEQRDEFANPELLGPGTDWQSELFQPAPMQNHQLSFSGGNETVNYFLSGNYLDQEGIIIGSDFQRYSLRANLSANVKDWLTVGTTLNGNRTDENRTFNGNQNAVSNMAILQSPLVPVRNLDGSFAGPSDPDDVESTNNPVAEALEITNTLRQSKLFANLWANLQFADWISFRTEAGGDFGNVDALRFQPTFQRGRFVNTQAVLDTRRQNNNFWVIKNLLTLQKNFNETHDTKLLLGHEMQESKWDGITASASGFASNDLHSLNQGDAETAVNDQYKDQNSLLSYFARGNYEFQDKYGLTATFRADGSSKFDPLGDNQWGYFPAFAGYWKISNESFFEGMVKTINSMKLRVGWGQVGNQNIPNRRYSSNIVSTPTGIGQGALTSNFSNPDVKWESATQTNIGLDLYFLDYRLTSTIDVYDKISQDFLYQLPVPSIVSGSGQGQVGPPYVNLGEMQNRGIDFSFGYNTDPENELQWKSSLNLSHYKNNLVELISGLDRIDRVTNISDFLQSPLTYTEPGSEIGLFYGYVADGIFTDESQFANAPQQFEETYSDAYGDTWLGDVRYKDLNGDGFVNEADRTIIGNPHPDFTYGWTNTFNYKNFEASVFLQGSQGNDLMNLSRRLYTSASALYRNQLAVVAGFWSPENTNTEVPRPRRGDENPNNFISSRYIEDGSYLRIQNVRLGYTIPQSVSQKIKMNRLRLYGTVQNLYTFTNYTGLDPEVGSLNQDALLLGVENGRYPSPRTFTVGLNVEF